MGFWKYVLGTPRNYALTRRKIQMGKILSLRGAINLIWETVEIGREMESIEEFLLLLIGDKLQEKIDV